MQLCFFYSRESVCVRPCVCVPLCVFVCVCAFPGEQSIHPLYRKREIVNITWEDRKKKEYQCCKPKNINDKNIWIYYLLFCHPCVSFVQRWGIISIFPFSSYRMQNGREMFLPSVFVGRRRFHICVRVHFFPSGSGKKFGTILFRDGSGRDIRFSVNVDFS